MERAIFLYRQGRHEMAAAELRDAIAREPDNAIAYCFLALSLRELKQFDAAQAAAERARELDPNESFAHFVFSRVMESRNLHREALAAIEIAITLDPGDKHYYLQRASLHIDIDKWNEALRDSELALEIDPEDSDARNFRAMALRRLGRDKEAGEDLEDVLAKNPEDSLTHANRGWSLLHQGRHEKAKEHFQEALRLDPSNEFAREGYVDCLKSRSSIYALLLRFLLWQGQLAGRIGTQGLIVGGVVLLVATQFLPRNSTAELIFTPLFYVFIVLFNLTYASEHIFNLLLRADPVGRHVLNDEERFSSTIVGGWFFLTGLMAYPHLLTGSRLWAPFPIMMLGMTLILVMLFHSEKGWPRRYIAIAFGVLLLSLIVFFCETFYIRWYAQNMGLSIPPTKTGASTTDLANTVGAFGDTLKHLLDMIDLRARHYRYHSYAFVAALAVAYFLEDAKVKR